ncbi:WcaF family extracellular polysaccharide biosynthesis acetyltransferase [Flavihumibacter petaseus]|uniref:Putative polysaccharide biosynthesis acetyltransferase n=1 Tax=Flavihumibacter petaseus NBRC 106054 TaxID=1220578 RepID=A0A0E9N674_9BACT|nr:WcaF family extracellular polysaccharide biosynthesis acetyltransferase [Flavihumibacter petaseus]GAO45206.1 putative polysaccharide biosynthesis acetyltransferase [Flavihumibacter petaseus NBRC 106054]
MNEKKKVNNSLYRTTHDPGATKLKRALWYLVNALIFKSALFAVNSLKVALLRIFGAKIGNGTVIKPVVNIKYPWKLQTGNYCWIGEEVWIDNLSDVTMGDNVTLSQGAMLLTGSHDHRSEKFDFLTRPIVLEDGVWITAKAIVFGGVTARTHSILGISAVAEKDLEPYTIYKGVPAVAVSERNIS